MQAKIPVRDLLSSGSYKGLLVLSIHEDGLDANFIPIPNVATLASYVDKVTRGKPSDEFYWLPSAGRWEYIMDARRRYYKTVEPIGFSPTELSQLPRRLLRGPE